MANHRINLTRISCVRFVALLTARAGYANRSAKRMTAIRIILKLVAAVVVWIVIAEAITAIDLTPFSGTLVLVAFAAVVLFFYSSKSARILSIVFLLMVVIVSRAVDEYFWTGVWDRGYPWPFTNSIPTNAGFIGSVSPFVFQVSIVSFVINFVIALALGVWYFVRRYKLKRN